MPLIIGLDLDDTLMPTARQYHRVMWKCGAIIDAALGVRSPHPKDIIDYQQKTDIASIQRFGYAISRFGQSWVQSYEHFAHEFQVEVDPAVVSALEEAALGFSRGPFLPFDGIPEALNTLRSQGHELHCISAGYGAEALQIKKLDDMRLRSLFDTVTITDSDKTAAMQTVFVDRQRSLMIGDSKSHDIQPALRLGVRAVWIPSTSWSFMHADLDGQEFDTLRSVTEVPKYLANHPQLSLL